MIRGRMQVHDEVRACKCSSTEDSPTTARRDTMSNLHPFSSFLPTGNQLVILYAKVHRLDPLSVFSVRRAAIYLGPSSIDASSLGIRKAAKRKGCIGGMVSLRFLQHCAG